MGRGGCGRLPADRMGGAGARRLGGALDAACWCCGAYTRATLHGVSCVYLLKSNLKCEPKRQSAKAAHLPTRMPVSVSLSPLSHSLWDTDHCGAAVAIVCLWRYTPALERESAGAHALAGGRAAHICAPPIEILSSHCARSGALSNRLQ